jgi:hypothetical protein
VVGAHHVGAHVVYDQALRAVGLDAGITSLVTLSTGEKVTNPKHEINHASSVMGSYTEPLRSRSRSAGRNGAPFSSWPHMTSLMCFTAAVRCRR